jgi:hypothetical protein
VSGDQDVEHRVRALIQRIEAINTYQPDGESRTHWFNCGMDEAYDNVLDWLYRDVLNEER